MRALCFALMTAMASPALAAECGGDFGQWLSGVKAEAIAAGEDQAVVERFFAGAAPDARVIKAGIRASDAAPMAVIELVDRDVSAKGQDSGPVFTADDE